MSKLVANPVRLSHLPASEDALGMGRMFRNARELPDEELPTLRWQLRTSQRMRVLRPRLYLRVGLVVGLAFCAGGVVGAGVWPFWPKREADPVTAVAPRPAAPTAKARKPRTTTPSPIVAGVPEPGGAEARLVGKEADRDGQAGLCLVEDGGKAWTPVEGGLINPVPAQAKRRARRVAMLNAPPPTPAPVDVPPVAPPVAPAAAKPSAIAVEQAVLGQAVKVLRDGHDARAALVLLAQHAEQFPRGALASEEGMLRIEALLALGRHDEALSVLDGTPLASLPKREERLVVRGELRAAKHRWREAKQDFDDALGTARSLPAATAKARDVQERALWGRASARSRLGDQEGARADLELYLRHFPAGRFAGSATSLLKGTP